MKNKGPAGFEAFYAQLYGPRWTTLKSLLTGKPRKVALLNPFHPEFAAQKNRFHSVYDLPISYIDGDSTPGLTYELDLASIFASLALPLKAGDTWMDLCAAPGGKTLTQIFAHHGAITTYVNDASNARMQRLKAVLHDYLPPEEMARVHISVCEGALYKTAPDLLFDGVLVDAPCSGERHLLQDAKALEEWSEKRSQGLAIRQHALLCNALAIVRPGGFIVYSTCSLSPVENDAVIKKLLKKREGQFAVCHAPLWLGARTEWGVQITPDLNDGFGPIYYTLLQKTEG